MDINDERFGWEFVRLWGKKYDLPYDIWFDEIGIDRNNNPNPIVKITEASVYGFDCYINSDDTIEFSEPIKFDEQCLKDFIFRFRDIIRKHWNHEITSYSLLTVIKDVIKYDIAIEESLENATKEMESDYK